MPRKKTDGVPKKQTTSEVLKAGKLTSKEKDLQVLDSTVPFPIVGIGASAGGLEAFEQFFTHTPPDTGMAFVLVQHLDPKHKSILSELVQRYTKPVDRVKVPTTL
jgi:two-component system, chemotaxis family, CheB/CheR fusion protein